MLLLLAPFPTWLNTSDRKAWMLQQRTAVVWGVNISTVSTREAAAAPESLICPGVAITPTTTTNIITTDTTTTATRTTAIAVARILHRPAAEAITSDKTLEVLPRHHGTRIATSKNHGPGRQDLRNQAVWLRGVRTHRIPNAVLGRDRSNLATVLTPGK
jgi:hypothetical protein